jgi:ribonuclease Z
MTATTVTLTGTGVLHPSPGRAGPGVLVRHGDVALQFDAGRATVLRLTEAGTGVHELDALFVTHVHSDHVVDLADVVMTRWVQGTLHPSDPLPIVAVDGVATRFVSRMLDAYVDDIDLRIEHVQEHPPRLDLQPFSASRTPAVVWRSDDDRVVVEAVAVHHEPVPEAVAYRVRTPAGVVVVSGDTRVCDEVRDLAAGADVLVHETCRTTTMQGLFAGTAFERIFDYHADTVALGALADDAGVGHLVLTHLIPPPANDTDAAGFADDVRRGGYTGRLTVGADLDTVEIG